MKTQRKKYKLNPQQSEKNMQLSRKMSAQNVMASITRSLGNRNDYNVKASNEVKFAGEESKDKLYEPKHRKKAFRVMTVIAYLISVSLAAIILSLYYTFIWNPKDHTHYVIRHQSKLNLTKIECSPSLSEVLQLNATNEEITILSTLNNAESVTEMSDKELKNSLENSIEYNNTNSLIKPSSVNNTEEINLNPGKKELNRDNLPER